MKIRILNEKTPVIYAKDELSKYLLQMGNEINEQGKVIELGLYSDFKKIKQEDNEKEDSFVINIKKGKGFIAGSNPRSVLYGVYKYLKELGCDWVRPGKDGEIVPKRDVKQYDVILSEKASYNYRGVCMAGSISIENVFSIAGVLSRYPALVENLKK
ncbi:MAG: hypothetical protein J6V58_02980 [Clostridia bacterium]|nr:hypothetical protein [Clostridia bacterium]